MLKFAFLKGFLNQPGPSNTNTPDWRLSTWLVALIIPSVVVSAGSPAPDWLTTLPLWADAIVYGVLAIALIAGMQCVRGWLQPFALRGAKASDFCKPVYLWAFFWASVASSAAMCFELAFTKEDGVGFVTGIVFFSVVLAITCAGQYFWLRPRKFLRAGFWRFLAVLSIGSGFAFLLAPWMNVPAFSETLIGASIVWVGGVISAFVYGAVYYLYANSEVFRENLGESDRAPANFDYAPTNLNVSRI
jgi:uncharacterized membrane protein (DUF485 family)